MDDERKLKLVRKALNTYCTVALIEGRSFDESFTDFDGKFVFWFNDGMGSTHAVTDNN